MLGRLLPKHIKILIEPNAQRDQIKADPGQLEQVIMNLAVNARDAMPQGGQLKIQTLDHEQTEKAALGKDCLEPGRYVVLSVSDSGCGMPPEVREKLFQPFFTTKEAGKGTGLGLSIIYGIVKEAMGVIQVISETGAGTTFRIFLPSVSMVTNSLPTGQVVAQPAEA